MSPFVRLSIFFFVFFWFAGIFVLFWGEFYPSLTAVYPFVNLLYSRVCHQIPFKLIHIHNITTLVCARCTGIYAGALIGSFYTLFAYRKIKISLRILLLFSVPLIADVVLYSAGLYTYSHYAAFFTGMLFGTICFFYIFQGLNLLYSELKSGK